MKKEGVKKKKSFFDFIVYFIVKVNNDDIFALGAQLAYYLVLSFFPFLFFFMTLIGYSNLDSIKENADYLFVYINKNSAITLRKTDLSKEEYSFIVTNISKALNKRTNSVANKK